MAEPLIEREEVVALLFNVADVAVGVRTIIRLTIAELRAEGLLPDVLEANIAQVLEAETKLDAERSAR